ncbi:DNA sulfur modification protein DndB [Vibrio kasasachensis]|uniref:DNA sulfur modification protein DndB n=1 Tax=Vibrio kasasachensis TaxID=2910248 RepID=UPI003D149227
MSSKLQLVESTTLNEAKNAAYDEASASHKNVMQVIIFSQGNRICASGTLHLGRMLQITTTDPVVVKNKGQASLEQVRNAYNRPVNKEHVRAVADYLVANINGKYILPSITVNAVTEHTIFTVENEGVRIGYMLIDLLSANLTVTDGQHRLRGIKDAIAYLKVNGFTEDAEKLESDGISIMFSFESNKDQIHQDFADCSKTKALPKSMIAVYDKRVPVNRLTMDIIDNCALYTDGRVDTASKSLGGTSTAFALANNVRTALKALYTGKPSMADDTFDNLTNHSLGAEDKYKEFYLKAFHYLNLLIDNNKILSDIARIPFGPERERIPNYRRTTFIANPAGINLCCSLINEISSNHYLTNEEKDEFIIKMAKDLDWSKSSPLLDGAVIIRKDEKNKHGEWKYAIQSTNSAVKKASNRIKVALGYKSIDELEIIRSI